METLKVASAAAGETVPPGVATGGQTQIPYYDVVVLKQEVELKENVAYCYNYDIAHNSFIIIMMCSVHPITWCQWVSVVISAALHY